MTDEEAAKFPGDEVKPGSETRTFTLTVQNVDDYWNRMVWAFVRAHRAWAFVRAHRERAFIRAHVSAIDRRREG
jgi:hypothetical protein